MTFTRRGRFIAGLVVAGFLWGVVFGIPALNAIVLPGIVALGVGWFLVTRAGPPSVDRSPVEAAVPGERRTVELHISHPNAVTVRARDTVPEGADAADGSADRPVVDESMVYEIVADERGIARIGPVTVRYTDPLGVYARSFEIDERAEMITYPTIHQIDWWAARSALRSEGMPTRERHVFDRLREYDPGDPLRDVHWRSSAKRQDHEFIVKEFVADSERGALRIVGESAERWSDEMASAVASLALWLLDDGIPVGIELADRSVPVAGGGPQRRRILLALARTAGGRLDPETRRGAPVLVEVDGRNGVTVEFGDRDVTFDEVVRRSGRSSTGVRVATDGGTDE